jgi:hypothetical protein
MNHNLFIALFGLGLAENIVLEGISNLLQLRTFTESGGGLN